MIWIPQQRYYFLEVSSFLNYKLNLIGFRESLRKLMNSYKRFDLVFVRI